MFASATLVVTSLGGLALKFVEEQRLRAEQTGQPLPPGAATEADVVGVMLALINITLMLVGMLNVFVDEVSTVYAWCNGKFGEKGDSDSGSGKQEAKEQRPEVTAKMAAKAHSKMVI